MLSKSVGEEEAGYYKSFVNLKKVFESWKRACDVLSISLSIYVQSVFYYELSNFEDEIRVRGEKCNTRLFKTWVENSGR